MSAKVHSAQTIGLRANIIDVETDLTRGLHSFSVVGLPDKAVEESKDRISAALKNSGFASPRKGNQKVVVSLAPADLKKEGPVFDLPIALAYLLASRQAFFDSRARIFIGELALDGSLRPVKGALVLARFAAEKGFREIFVPKKNEREAALVGGIEVFGCEKLEDIAAHFDGARNFSLNPAPRGEVVLDDPEGGALYDFSDIKGQESAKRGLEIAAAGGHNALMVGPPGTGKTMLARAFASILPPMTFEEALEATAVHSVAGTLRGGFVSSRPFRAPHHTSSHVALVGGGACPKPGEITLSHRGVLFLDEFPEFDRRVIDALRQPLEDGSVTVSRAKGSVDFPARFIMVCAMNPCPCGNSGSKKPCSCSQAALERYRRKISGPVADRVDLWLEVPRVDHGKLAGGGSEERSESVRERVARAREIQRRRFENAEFFRGRRPACNAEMGARELEKFVPLSPKTRSVLDRAAEALDFSGRAYHRVLKLSRTIADLDGEEEVSERHVLEALQYRPRG